jgi:hypothetical protein
MLTENGYAEQTIPAALVKEYLYAQRYISRYLPDGRRHKTNGYFVWIVEARRTPDGGWIFKEFERRIVGEDPAPVALVGQRWRWAPKLYDSQVKGEKKWCRNLTWCVKKEDCCIAYP